jgi:hypothetical protein
MYNITKMCLLDCFGLEKIVPPLYESPWRLLHHAGTGTFIRKEKGGEWEKGGGRERKERERRFVIITNF